MGARLSPVLCRIQKGRRAPFASGHRQGGEITWLCPDSPHESGSQGSDGLVRKILAPTRLNPCLSAVKRRGAVLSARETRLRVDDERSPSVHALQNVARCASVDQLASTCAGIHY